MWFFLYFLVPLAVLDLIIDALASFRRTRVKAPPVPEHLFPFDVHVHSRDAPNNGNCEEHEHDPEDTSSDAHGTMNWVVSEVGALRVNYETWQEYKPDKKKEQ